MRDGPRPEDEVLYALAVGALLLVGLGLLAALVLAGCQIVRVIPTGEAAEVCPTGTYMVCRCEAPVPAEAPSGPPPEHP